MDLPKYVEKGQTIPADEWNKMVAALASLAPCNSDDIIPSQTPSGTTWRLRKQKNALDDIHPFKVVGSAEGGFHVWYGTVGGQVPTGVCSGGDMPVHTGTGDVYIECEIGAGGAVSAASIHVGTCPAGDEETAYILLAEVMADGLIYQAVIHSLSYFRYYFITEEGMDYAHVFGAI